MRLLVGAGVELSRRNCRLGARNGTRRESRERGCRASSSPGIPSRWRRSPDWTRWRPGDSCRQTLQGSSDGPRGWRKSGPERDLERAEAAGARFVIPGDDEWPEQVEVLADAGQLSRRGGVPFGLWVRGKPRPPPGLGEVCRAWSAPARVRRTASTRPLSSPLDSRRTASRWSPAARTGSTLPLTEERWPASGMTIAVLACGVDVSYPKSNTALFDRIAEDGLVVSELPPGCSPTKLRFLARNRLIAATTLGTVVVEAAVRSGALNSAGWAEQCGRPVLAVPGPITSRMSEGVHLLVRERRRRTGHERRRHHRSDLPTGHPPDHVPPRPQQPHRQPRPRRPPHPRRRPGRPPQPHPPA